MWEFIEKQLLGMRWLNELIGRLMSLLGIDPGTRIGGSVQFFLYDVIKITLLLCILIFAGFLFNLATDLSGYVIGPALLLILGFDIYFLITTQWIHVAILTMLGAGCFVVLFSQAVVIVALEGARDGLIRFMRS